jgi:anhydro-N-acetylmuramic acid kinase
MKQLIDIIHKKKRLVVGLMSGTSVDGIDAALVEIEGSGTSTKLRQVGFKELHFPSGFKEFVLRNSQSGTSDVADIARLNFLLAQLYADAVKAVCREAGVEMLEVDLIGSHGQTIQHLPELSEMFGKSVRATLQVGDPSVLAKLTGIVTIGDFRVGDVALGGQGAPLVPYFDFLLFRSEETARALLNIGGIANITYLGKSCRAGDVLAFDTGPGNMIVDQIMKQLFQKDFDFNGEIARSGKVQGDIIDMLMKDEFVRMGPPKSTGRERYGSLFVSSFLSRYEDRRKEDLVATVSEFTAMAVYANYLLFLKPKGDVEEVFVSGGGSHNSLIMESLQHHFAVAKVRGADDLGISTDAKEAICFAVLANETLSGNTSNLKQVTGASKDTLLGKICLP